MSEHYCPSCGPKWSGAFNLDHCCVTCGSVVRTRDENSCCEQMREENAALREDNAKLRREVAAWRGA